MFPLENQARPADRRWPRRAWLRMGAFTALAGLAAPKRLRSAGDAPAAAGFGRAKSVVLVFANGGQSQLDMWDLKPAAPLDVRGAFQPIRTRIPGVQFCEHMPQIAAVADRLTVVRSMSHEDLDHGSAAYLALTGCYHTRRSSNPPPSASDAPTYGAVLRRVRSQPRFVSDAVHLNGPALLPFEAGPGQNGGFLGRAFEPLVVGDSASAAGAIPGLAPQFDLPPERMDDRLALKQTLDHELKRLDIERPARDLDSLYSQARAMLASTLVRDAFDLSAEPLAIRERYGRHRSGQALLLARRLVEAGVPYINVIWNHSNRGQDESSDTDQYGWDTHNDIFSALRDHLIPRFDRSFSAFIGDLDERGLLDQTLVVCMGEFGRAPRVALEPRFAGATPGRKHWASAYSIVLAGAGVQRGAVVGATDRMGGEPITDRYGPWDVAATIFHALGIDPHSHYLDALGRPLAIASGKPIGTLYSG